jgi:hypothetical protein
VFKSGVKALKFELKARILALGDKNSRDKHMWLAGVGRGLLG